MPENSSPNQPPTEIWITAIILMCSAAAFIWLGLGDRDHHPLYVISGIEVTMAVVLALVKKRQVLNLVRGWFLMALLSPLGWFVMAGRQAWSSSMWLADENTRLTIVFIARAVAAIPLLILLTRKNSLSVYLTREELLAQKLDEDSA